MTLELLLDLILSAALVVLGWRALWSERLFTSIVLFIAFGLLMAVVWVRLAAPDIALAEAAVGAGVTGALLLDAARELRPTERDARRTSRGSFAGAITFAALAALFLLLAAATLEVAGQPGGLASTVAAAMPDAASEHPVTAVLLEFRGYDTWLETAVLLLAALGVLAVRGTQHPLDADSDAALGATADPMLRALLRTLIPLLVLCAGYLLWLGTHAPGGAFQSGALLGSAGILLAVSGTRSVTAMRALGLRAVLLAGVAAFTAVAAAGAVLGGSMLELPVGVAPVLLVLVETAVALSVGVTLTVLFVGGRAAGAAPPATGEEVSR